MPSNKKRGVAFLINALGFGGAERVFVDDANALSAAGYKVTFFILYGDEKRSPLAQELGRDVNIAYLGARSPYDLVAVWRCVRAIRRDRIRVLLSTLNEGNVFARWVVMCTGVRLFQREANILASKSAPQKTLDFLFGWMPFRYLAVSREVCESLVELVFYVRTRVVFFPNAVAVQTEMPPASHPVPHLIAVGRLTPQKDHATLIRALSMLKQRGIPFHATLIGEGILRGELEAQIREEKLDAVITLPGQLLHRRVCEEYRNADIFVSSSRWEGSPNVLLEAMSYGLACISTAVGGVNDILSDGENGILIEPGDPAALAEALETLSGNAELRARLGRAARTRISVSFSREARLERLQVLIDAA